MGTLVCECCIGYVNVEWRCCHLLASGIPPVWGELPRLAPFQYDREICIWKEVSYGRKAPVPATCDSVEALLRHELLAHLPEWLSRKAGVLGCTSSPTILFMCWKEIFPNEDATRFDLVDELYALQRRCPPACTNSHHGLRIGWPNWW